MIISASDWRQIQHKRNPYSGYGAGATLWQNMTLMAAAAWDWAWGTKYAAQVWADQVNADDATRAQAVDYETNQDVAAQLKDMSEDQIKQAFQDAIDAAKRVENALFPDWAKALLIIGAIGYVMGYGTVGKIATKATGADK